MKNGETKGGRTRWSCNQCGFRTTGSSESQKNQPGYDVEAARARMKYLKKLITARQIKRFVVTSAQNNTRVNKKQLTALESYCRRNDAELMIIPIHYKNVTAYKTNQDENKSWAPEVEKYFVTEALKISNQIIIRADVKIPATTFSPLSGKEPINGKLWTVFGHPQFAMETVASPLGIKSKRMYTTGAVTVKNYSQTNVGAKAEFHHVQGALVVEIDRGNVWVRQLNADHSGGFYDLETYYKPDGRILKTGRILALTTGDEHVKFNKKSVRRATYDDDGSLVSRLRPRFIVRHDVLDGYAGSHHHEKNDVLQFQKFHRGDNDYRRELDQVVDFINGTTPPDARNVIVASNHHDHLYMWLSRVDPKEDPTNALFIHELKQLQYLGALNNTTTDPFELYVSPKLNRKAIFLGRGASFVLKGVDYAQHGDVGLNGARGSAQSLAKTTYKLVIGHTHSARIVKGVYQVGTSAGTLEYEKGLGARSNTHCIQYPNGKRTLIDIFNGRWRL